MALRDRARPAGASGLKARRQKRGGQNSADGERFKAASRNYLPAPGNAFRVLIVEDEVMIGLLLETVLEEMRFEVCAIEARCNPQLMIMDARHRGESGILAVKQINHARFVPHVFVSGDKLTDYSFDPRAVVLQKPFLDAELARAIQRALGA